MSTMTEVREMEARVTALEHQTATLAARERELTAQIAEHHATGAGDLAALTQERRKVREERADLLATLPLLQERIASAREAACRHEAKQRLTGIARAHGSLREELGEDVAKFEVAVDTLLGAADRLNTRYRSVKDLGREADALGDRFGLPVPALPKVTAPVFLAQAALKKLRTLALLEHGFRAPETEQCEHGMRVRRTYAEVAHTPGYTIIQDAGLLPFPELTERQRQGVAEREAHAARDRETAARMRQETDTVFPTSGTLR